MVKSGTTKLTQTYTVMTGVGGGMLNEEQVKNWTIMIYANGNNDLQPEMRQAKLAAERIRAGDKVNIVLQIGREDANLVNIIRPGCALGNQDGERTGVRRYFLTDTGWVMAEHLGKKNMADPNCLYQFVKEAIESYPAEHYLLILGGHGYQFVGLMPDYSQEVPYIMGICEMAAALRRACRESGAKIDILIADVCYFNFIEVIYEFTDQDQENIDYILTYICDGPLAGMPYGKIIEQVQNCGSQTCGGELLLKLVDDIDADLVAVSLEYARLERIKQIFHNLAVSYLQNNGAMVISPNELLFNSDIAQPWYPLAQAALHELTSCICYYKRLSVNDYGLINIANVPTNSAKLDSFYLKLRFARDNAWTELLSMHPLAVTQSAVQQRDTLAPIVLAPEEVYAYISLMNPTLTKEQKIDILERLAEYKNWRWFN